ncbi:hypothetical protein ACA910_001454 [Epithemia clementina (nom. ined.)]
MFRFGAVIVGLVAMAGGLLYAKQESLLYLPTVQGQIPRHNSQNPQGLRSPTERGVQHWFNVRIPTTDGIRIHAWYLLHPVALQQPSRKLPTLIFFHGNAGNIGLRLPNAIQMMQHLNCHVLLVEYRGYGDSDDKSPTEQGLKLDAQAAYEWIALVGSSSLIDGQVEASSSQLKQLSVSDFVDTTKLYVFGRSLGGAVGFSLADYVLKQKSRLPPMAGLIVENTFLNISAMVDRIFPFLKAIKPYVLRLDWNSQKIASSLMQTPILYLAGAKDDLVPHQHMQILYQTSLVVAGNPNTHMHVIPNGTHNESWHQGGSDYWKAIRQFLSQQHSLTATMSASSQPESGSGGTAIPTMSQSIVDMAKGAFASSSTTSTDKKKS